MTKKNKNRSQSLRIPRIILLICGFLAFISTKLVTLFAAKLFTTPIKHKLPKRELEMNSKSIQNLIRIPAIHKSVMVYEYGNSNRKILLVHGWSGRGTQLFKIADALLAKGYSTISFDAPAHGKSPGSTTIMVDFIAAIIEIDQQYGPFEAVIGHSLGGMAVLNALKKGLKVNKAIVIGSGDIVQDILDDFIAKLELKPNIATELKLHFEKKYNEKMDDFSAYKAAAMLSIPVLVLHDTTDDEVPVKAGIHIHKHLKNGQLVLTDGLGHRKILGDTTVINKVISFLKEA
ncbi:alpha/beta fold hydrolase [Flavobacterium restrictum]|uniref:Alpha/beta hydrolase n=1 Tax=Flavobacterium restrictum TaxID=2594428 RepID=A0A553DSG7_9FLAO|nr:alpha/beta hydrolase [Flavobacterium restrictum]TRX35676.1 alpha/beta hydrolase [Flavobacterium restrictum]